MASNGVKFALDVSAFVKKAGDRMDTFVRHFVGDFTEEVVRNSPVRTGFFRGNWQVAQGSVPDGLVTAVGGVSAAMLATTSLTAGAPIYLVNNTSYGIFIEQGTWKMAAQAPVRRAVVRAPAIAQMALAKTIGSAA